MVAIGVDLSPPTAASTSSMKFRLAIPGRENRLTSSAPLGTPLCAHSEAPRTSRTTNSPAPDRADASGASRRALCPAKTGDAAVNQPTTRSSKNPLPIPRQAITGYDARLHALMRRLAAKERGLRLEVMEVMLDRGFDTDFGAMGKAQSEIWPQVAQPILDLAIKVDDLNADTAQTIQRHLSATERLPLHPRALSQVRSQESWVCLPV